MKKINISILLYSFVISFFITSAFIALSYFYIKKIVSEFEMKEHYTILQYANKISKQKRTIDEFKNYIFGTSETFIYKIAIIDKNGNSIYSTFQTVPLIDSLNMISIENNTINLFDIIEFSNVGKYKIILQKELNYSDIKNKIILIVILIGSFLILCTVFIYIHTAKVHNIMNRNLERFLKDAIHEIRTPLGVIQINLEFLESKLEESMPLLRAQGALQNLISIYENIEYFIKDTKVTYKKEKIDLSEVLENRIEFFRILADVKKIKIISTIHKDILIEANIVEIQRLIDNNLSNAIKYSKVGSRIDIILEKNQFHSKLIFTNLGEQIQDVTKIFQRYYRGDNIRGGFGLGLNMVQNICHKYKIFVDVNSQDNGYTTFIYEIPMNK